MKLFFSSAGNHFRTPFFIFTFCILFLSCRAIQLGASSKLEFMAGACVLRFPRFMSSLVAWWVVSLFSYSWCLSLRMLSSLGFLLFHYLLFLLIFLLFLFLIFLFAKLLVNNAHSPGYIPRHWARQRGIPQRFICCNKKEKMDWKKRIRKGKSWSDEEDEKKKTKIERKRNMKNKQLMVNTMMTKKI